MDVINKFYSSVSSTVSQLSGVLPGNPVTREYEVTSHIASAGPGLLWKVYNGYKKSTKQEAAVFVFEKKQLERWTKADRDLILESLKRGVGQLTKLRHPQILTVQHPLEESRESLAFATEPIFASLANALGQTDNMPHPVPNELADYKFFEVEIKYGLLQIGEGLAFLHNDVKLLHRNICPESIIINKQGAWKIFGFDFCVHNEAQPNNQPSWPFTEYNSVLPAVIQPSLNYMAPEFVLTQSHFTSSDIFSLGVVAYTLHSPIHQPIIPCSDYHSFKQRAQQLKQLPVSKLQPIPEGLRDFIKMMLNTTPELRPDAHQFVKIPYFEDIGVKTLNYLDSLLQWDNMQKSQFYKGLPDSIQKLPPRVRLLRVLPCLVRDLIQPIMVPFVLPNVLNIAEGCTKEQYKEFILPHLKPVMKLMDPIQILLIFLQRMELLLKLTPAEDIQQDVLPMLYRGLDGDAYQIHELCLNVLPTFAGLLDHAAVKNSVLPRVKRLCLSTQSLSVRVNCLLCLGRLLEHLDKWLVLDEILPFLPQIPSREPAVLMGILGIYKMALDHKKLGITKEVIATRILPFLIPLSIENGLTIQQFNALVTLIKQMFQMVETEHRTKLEQLNSVQQERKTLDMNFVTGNSTSAANVSQNDAKLEAMFGGLGLDSYLSSPVKTVKSPVLSVEVQKDSSSLSLQEKQRLVQQQDQVKLFQKQSMLSPQSVTPSANAQQPIDLTSTLSSQSIASFPTVPKKITSPEEKPVQFGLQSNYLQSPTSSSAFNSLQSNTGMHRPNMSMFSSPNANNFKPATATSPVQFTTPPINQPWSPPAQNLPWGFNQHQQSSTPHNGHNWSALDSLLPNANQQKIPMNQMIGVRQPLLQSPNRDSKAANNVLSKDDIMDLLS